MDQSGHYIPHRQPQLFQPPVQLPPPSQLHLPMPFSRSNTLPPNTLPPIPTIPANPRFSTSSGYQLSPSASATLPPLPSASSWSSHRMSSSRDEVYAPSHHHSEQRQDSVKREARDHPPQPQHDHKETTEDGMPTTSDFVKKLYKMLEDASFSNIVSWGPAGDCFVVKDMNEFTKSVLPRLFKHSNFASFVRQLNKYDFHKVKNTDDNQFGEQSWTFRHPDFHASRPESLENIKRKVPAQRKSTNSTGRLSDHNVSPAPNSAGCGAPECGRAMESLQLQIDRLVRQQDEMVAHVRNLEGNYQNVLGEMVNFQRTMAQQDGLMQNLIQYFLQLENAKLKDAANQNNDSSNNGGTGNAAASTSLAETNPFLPAQEAQRMMGAYPENDVARASLVQMNEISRRAEVAGMSFAPNGAQAPPSQPPPPQDPDLQQRPMSRQDMLSRIEELSRSAGPGPSSLGQMQQAQQEVAAAAAAAEAEAEDAVVMPDGQYMPEAPPAPAAEESAVAEAAGSSHQGLQVFTLGHLMPKSGVDDANGNWSFDPNCLGPLGSMFMAGAPAPPADEQQQQQSPQQQEAYAMPQPTNAAAAAAEASGSMGLSLSTGDVGARPSSVQKLRVRRSTYVPGWAVPPRVLLVEDDAVSRKLSSKFLQVFGCNFDVAVDGVGAVNKMNLEKYDLVLMDIVMPKLDGVSATSLIRQFDHMTPIISMTSNSKPNEIMTYYSSGMNDILPKPFSKQGLLDMLEKHLMHLKVIQQMSRIPRSVGIPPLSDPSFDQALAMQANSMFQPGQMADEDGKINPLAGMGLTDEQYAMILQSMVNGESFPGIPAFASGSGSGSEKRGLDEETDGRDPKRSRFEVVE
ncbi:hypothetical protein GLOTRDRAFT_119791 [Gloeophyllum trabeum ATCC 11539]|uniref:Response regulatory domain-containing protein n=1 Tax=Gloeophyllum trabeum (strain ATCC 11539 / FP-39264 / Madison 617) TaxID=670483 RepID=S7QD11_GLOTA|nr:uncharacterized protein GLOTRDRAFT_119791 [Gloeophyllum trabeum ATCC 11539]EPQ57751.1 hypothetical protein GLOTRDRAFT_119791 [Gloeophyllum trabeum ATCC 11539]